LGVEGRYFAIFTFCPVQLTLDELRHHPATGCLIAIQGTSGITVENIIGGTAKRYILTIIHKDLASNNLEIFKILTFLQ